MPSDARYGFTKRLSNFHKINKFHIHSVHYKSNDNNPFYNQYEYEHKHFNFDNDNNYFFNPTTTSTTTPVCTSMNCPAMFMSHFFNPSPTPVPGYTYQSSLNYCKTMVNTNSHLPYINSDAMNTAVTAAIGSHQFFMGIVKPPPYTGTSIMYFEYDDGTPFTTWTNWATNGAIV
ncbi:hypothetical protein WR25_12159 [Diploscapter pachys]|uniref:C-type lectin domain-containing protein n=1 Tax=Diploscapter pachys TaxID=2018661 RepID=A0A2A2KQN9_9BILA|nr:hypothetical protein WR25_12159 [Diploscapter pachys]